MEHSHLNNKLKKIQVVEHKIKNKMPAPNFYNDEYIFFFFE